ncbi:MAG TPA: hypothetical protein VF169_08895 [Albitalea sp.]|uniref:hypothetical protein n=1 Tax=Piscinibacter sp. TaxID=1903157 RepID=UPI002ED10059
MQTIEDKPVACTLDYDALTPRLAEIRTFTGANLLSHELDGRVLRLHYRPEAGPQLRRIVELERVCCAFLEFDLAETPREMQLTITAPSSADEGASWLFAQFLPDATGPQSAASCGCSRGAACG